MTGLPDHTVAAVAALLDGHGAESDFAGWLADVLACAAASLGSSAALIAGRPGGWEAVLVDQLVKGAVGHGDEDLTFYGREQGG
jgi:hypothetical protein